MDDVPMENETNSNSSESSNATAIQQQHPTPEFLQRKIYFLSKYVCLIFAYYKMFQLIELS